jgi:hypothetical protein
VASKKLFLQKVRLSFYSAEIFTFACGINSN